MADYSKYMDRELLPLLKEGNDRAFSVIYNRYFELLFRHALKMLKDEDEARDAIQDVFVNLWEKRSSLHIQSSVSGYLYTATHHAVLRLIGRSKLGEKYLDSVRNIVTQGYRLTEQHVHENELKRIIEQEISKLPPKMRQVFELSRVQYHSTAEIAEKLGLSENTVKRQISNALLILRKKLTDWIFLSLLISMLYFFSFFI